MKKTLFYILIFTLFPTLSFASFDYNLKYGAKGNAVVELQEFLADQGAYNGPISGNFFALTRAGVVKFQAMNQIKPASGYFGPMTRAKANEILTAQLDESDSAEAKEVGTVKAPVQETDNEKLLAKIDELQNTIKEQTKTQTTNLNQIEVSEVAQEKKADLSVFIGSNDIQVGLLRYKDKNPVFEVTPPEGFKVYEENKECYQNNTCSTYKFLTLSDSKERNLIDIPNGTYTFIVNAYGTNHEISITKGGDSTNQRPNEAIY